MKVAIVGSRKWPFPDDVQRFVRDLYSKYPHAVVVSGGAKGVDSLAETEALACGGSVVSLRPAATDYGFTTECWHLGIDHPYKERLANEPTWESYAGAAIYRNLLIAETAEFGVLFWDLHSRGTVSTKDAFAAEGKQTFLYTPKERYCVSA